MEPGAQAVELRFAGFWRRVAVLPLDTLVLTVELVLWILVAVLAFGPDHDAYVREAITADEFLAMEQQWEAAVDRHVDRQGRTAVWVGGLLSVLYFVGFWAWRGQTPGMMMLGIRIVRSDGSAIGLRKAALHYLGTVVTLFTGYITIIWDRRKQGLHDKIADTYVVRTRP